MTINSHRVLALACAFASTAAIFALLAPPPAAADIVSANWVNATTFNYRVTHMPDLDQRRNGAGILCQGNGWCFPTGATNIMMYIANHGFPTVDPGPGYWEGDTNYAAATAALAQMGDYMSTTCTGTNGSGSYDGVVTWLAGHDELLINDHKSNGTFSPTFDNIGKALCAGRLGRIGYGKYTITGDFKGVPTVERHGGHCMTVVKAHHNGALKEFWVHDPWSNENPTDYDHQSPFINNTYAVTDLLVIDEDDDLNWKWMTALDYRPGDATVNLIDGFSTVRPAQGYSFSSSLGAVVFLGPMNLLNPGGSPTTTHPAPTGATILSLAFHDQTGEVVAACTVGATQQLFGLDPVSHTSHPVATPFPPTLVATGRNNQLYLCNGSQATSLLYPAPTPPAPNPTQPLITLPFIAHAIAYEDSSDRLWFLSRTSRKIMRVASSLSGAIVSNDIPSSMPLGTRIQIALNPVEPGVLYVWSDASNSIWRLTFPGQTAVATPLNLPSAPIAQGVDFSDHGRMFVNNNGSLVEFMPVAGGWQTVAGSNFTGLPADREFHMMRSRTNFKSGLHDTPAWNDAIDASAFVGAQQADCPADIAPNLNTDNQVNVNDLLMVITTWGPCATAIRCPADINADHAVDVNDLLGVITTWGPCP